MRKAHKTTVGKWDVVDLHATLAEFILPRLRLFQETTYSYPFCLGSLEVWKATLNKMIFAFECIIADSDFNKTTQKKIRQGLHLFGKYYRDLWI